MKGTIQLLIFLTVICCNSAAQKNSKIDNRANSDCMTLLTERSNILYLNDTNYIEYLFLGHLNENLILKGDSTVNVIYRNNALPNVIPSKDTFELSLFDKSNDSLLFSETFIAIKHGALPATHNILNANSEFCDYIFSAKTESILYRSVPNKLILRLNNYDKNFITFEIDNGIFISDAPDNLIVQPGNGKICEIRAYYKGEMKLSRQFVVYK